MGVLIISGRSVQGISGTDRTDAHATIFHTASLLWSWSEQTLKRKYPELSLTEALRSLESLAWVRSGSGKSAREWPMKPTDEQKELLSALGAMRYLLPT